MSIRILVLFLLLFSSVDVTSVTQLEKVTDYLLKNKIDNVVRVVVDIESEKDFSADAIVGVTEVKNLGYKGFKLSIYFEGTAVSEVKVPMVWLANDRSELSDDLELEVPLGVDPKDLLSLFRGAKCFNVKRKSEDACRSVQFVSSLKNNIDMFCGAVEFLYAESDEKSTQIFAVLRSKSGSQIVRFSKSHLSEKIDVIPTNLEDTDYELIVK